MNNILINLIDYFSRIFTVYLPYIYRIFTVYLPYIYHIVNIYLPVYNTSLQYIHTRTVYVYIPRLDSSPRVWFVSKTVGHMASWTDGQLINRVMTTRLPYQLSPPHTNHTCTTRTLTNHPHPVTWLTYFDDVLPPGVGASGQLDSAHSGQFGRPHDVVALPIAGHVIGQSSRPSGHQSHHYGHYSGVVDVHISVADLHSVRFPRLELGQSSAGGRAGGGALLSPRPSEY